jgi:hypothetical protein
MVVFSRRNIVLLDGTPAVEVVTLRGTGVVGKSRNVYTLVNGMALVVVAEAYLDSWENLVPHFDQIIKSLTVRP